MLQLDTEKTSEINALNTLLIIQSEYGSVAGDSQCYEMLVGDPQQLSPVILLDEVTNQKFSIRH